jgi:hypothetical protein
MPKPKLSQHSLRRGILLSLGVLGPSRSISYDTENREQGL